MRRKYCIVDIYNSLSVYSGDTYLLIMYNKIKIIIYYC